MADKMVFDAWAPPDSIWSRWTKPVLFATARNVPATGAATTPSPLVLDRARIEPPPAGVTTYRSAPAAGGIAIVVELPGDEAVRAGLALAHLGFRPVPLFNALVPFGRMVPSVDVTPTVRALEANAPALRALSLAPDAPPAFLLDARRRGDDKPFVFGFDNRSYCLVSDFPSGEELRRRKIGRVVLLREEAGREPVIDVKDVLYAFQHAGIEIFAASMSGEGAPTAMTVRAPSLGGRLKDWIYRLAVGEPEAGAFGRKVPQSG